MSTITNKRFGELMDAECRMKELFGRMKNLDKTKKPVRKTRQVFL